MLRQSLLPFLLKHDVVASYQNDVLYILDRRQFPRHVSYYACEDVDSVVKALREMVTQGGANLEVALWAMVMADDQKDNLDITKEKLKKARPTNKTLSYELDYLLEKHRNHIQKGVFEILDKYDNIYDRMSEFGESLIEDGDGILTTCFPEHSFILSVTKAMERGKRVTVYVSETRPYLQGARLTRPSLEEMGVDCVLLTDNLASSYMKEGKITKFMTASDVAFPDKTVVNKIGTLQNAISSSFYKIPYYAFSVGLERERKSGEVEIEYRDASELNYINGNMISTRYYGEYPVFDIVDSSLVSGVITPDGIIK